MIEIKNYDLNSINKNIKLSADYNVNMQRTSC